MFWQGPSQLQAGAFQRAQFHLQIPQNPPENSDFQRDSSSHRRESTGGTFRILFLGVGNRPRIAQNRVKIADFG